MLPTISSEEVRKPLFHRATSWYAKFERPISSISLVGGFVFDAITLERVDTLWENIWIIAHLVVVAICIVLINRKTREVGDEHDPTRLHFWLLNIMQFFFGGLLSTYLVFYFRSSSILVSWPFLILLVGAFWANERLKFHYARITFHISFFFLSLYAFAIFIVPVLIHQVGTVAFLFSGLVSVVIILGFLALLEFMTHEQFFRGKSKLYYSITGIFLAVNALYFFNIIPPIPLSLKDAGVYHSISKDEAGDYVVMQEQRSWREYFKLYPTLHSVPQENVVAYSAVFSPSKLDTTIIHEWERYDQNAKRWVSVSKVSLEVIGGRDGGYRTYSTKNTLTPGRWRVSVETPRGQVIGRMPFEIVMQNTLPILSPKVVK